MKTSNVFWGVLLLVLGGMFLLDNLDIVCISLGEVWKFWPLILVFWGISALVKDTRARWIVAAVSAVVVAVLAYSFFSFRWVGCHGDDVDAVVEAQHLSEPYDSSITSASLTIGAGAAKLILGGTSDQLVDAQTRSSIGDCVLTSSGSEGRRDVDLEIPGKGHRLSFGRVTNEATIRLHPAPTWDISLGAGAASAELDLRPFDLKNVNIEAGATSVKLSLGMPKKETEVRIEAGASSITIEVPEQAACAISIDAPLSSKHFEGFEKIESGRYETEGFSEGAGKINISIEAGVSKVRVVRI